MLSQSQQQELSEAKSLIHEALASLRGHQVAAAEQKLQKALERLGKL